MLGSEKVNYNAVTFTETLYESHSSFTNKCLLCLTVGSVQNDRQCSYDAFKYESYSNKLISGVGVKSRWGK